MSSPAVPALPFDRSATLDARVSRLLRGRGDGLAVGPARAVRSSVRRRAAALRHRRRRLRHAFGSGTLAAGVAAGGVHGWLTRPADPGPPSAAPATGPARAGGTAPAPDPAPPPSLPPASPDAPARSWTWDAAAGVAREAADPAAIHADGRDHVFTTTAAHCAAPGACAVLHVPRFESPDLAEPGRLAGDALPELPPWVAPDDPAIWAPAVARVGDTYVLWFAATSGRPRDGRMKCLGAAVAAAPEGPFVPQPAPLHCTPDFWAIDPSPVPHEGGWSLLWRQDDARHHTGRIVVAPLRADGLALAGSPTPLLAGEEPWEEGYPDGSAGIGPVENPAMARHPVTGEWLLTWSANRWETQEYATGLAVCAGPHGPCERVGDGGPWLRTSGEPGVATTAELGGAGGLSFVAGADGNLDAVLHAYEGGGAAPAPRVAWAYRVEAVGPAGAYRLADIVRNQPGPASVIGT